MTKPKQDSSTLTNPSEIAFTSLAYCDATNLDNWPKTEITRDLSEMVFWGLMLNYGQPGFGDGDTDIAPIDPEGVMPTVYPYQYARNMAAYAAEQADKPRITGKVGPHRWYDRPSRMITRAWQAMTRSDRKVA